jgi:hypothetical protein
MEDTSLLLTVRQLGAEVGVGIVASTSPLTVAFRGTTMDANQLSSYAAAVNDRVAVIRQDATLLILGRIV